MGQNWSSDGKDADDTCAITTHKALGEKFSTFERLSVKQNMAEIGDDSDKLIKALGIQNFSGASVILCMANNLAEGSVSRHILAVIGWFDGRLAGSMGMSTYEWQRKLFKSACTSEIGGEIYIPYGSLSNLISLLISACNWHPEDLSKAVIPPLQVESLVEQMLSEIKAPAVRFEKFRDSVLDKYPYLFHSFALIWDRLLYDYRSVSSNSGGSETELDIFLRPEESILYCLLGPLIANSVKLYDGGTNGFAMRAFEHGVTKWPSSSILIVKGVQPKTLQKSWQTSSIEQIFPSSYDVPMKPAKNLTFALYVDEPWKSSFKFCVGGRNGFIVQLEPELHVWRIPPKSTFLTPSKGFGAGLDRPPKTAERTKETLLFIDDSMERAIFRRISDSGEKFEHRFNVRHVEVVGFGSQIDLEKQRKEWEWEESESERRRNVNVHEDRAILELAGIVGQYSG